MEIVVGSWIQSPTPLRRRYRVIAIDGEIIRISNGTGYVALVDPSGWTLCEPPDYASTPPRLR